MKKRLLAGLLALAMLFTMLPTAAFAANTKTLRVRYTVGGDLVMDDGEVVVNTIDIEAGTRTIRVEDLPMLDGYELDTTKSTLDIVSPKTNPRVDVPVKKSMKTVLIQFDDGTGTIETDHIEVDPDAKTVNTDNLKLPVGYELNEAAFREMHKELPCDLEIVGQARPTVSVPVKKIMKTVLIQFDDGTGTIETDHIEVDPDAKTVNTDNLKLPVGYELNEAAFREMHKELPCDLEIVGQVRPTVSVPVKKVTSASQTVYITYYDETAEMQIDEVEILIAADAEVVNEDEIKENLPKGYEIAGEYDGVIREGHVRVPVRMIDPTDPVEPVEPVKPAETDSCISALVGTGVVLAGGAAALAYYYREALPIWKYAAIVKLADDTPVQNATVTLIQDGETVKTVTTDDNGYIQTRVAKGTYQVVVTWERDGVQYTAHTEATVERMAGDIQPQEIVLALE